MKGITKRSVTEREREWRCFFAHVHPAFTHPKAREVWPSGNAADCVQSISAAWSCPIQLGGLAKKITVFALWRDVMLEMLIGALFIPTAFATSFGVKAVMKTSVLLTWEVPENYKSQAHQPFKVRWTRRAMRQLALVMIVEKSIPLANPPHAHRITTHNIPWKCGKEASFGDY